jgi:hypothetical protein
VLIAKHQSDPGQKTYMLNYRYLLYCTVVLQYVYTVCLRVFVSSSVLDLST